MREFIIEYDDEQAEEAMSLIPWRELVRCKDCKHYLGLAECHLIGACMGTQGYCAWAERKEKII